MKIVREEHSFGLQNVIVCCIKAKIHGFVGKCSRQETQKERSDLTYELALVILSACDHNKTLSYICFFIQK